MILHGKDDVGIQKSGFLWKQTRNSFKPWKQYYFVLTRLCLICYHRGSNGIQGKNPKLKVDLSEVTRVEVLCSNSDRTGSRSVVAGGKKRAYKYAGRQFTVWYGQKGRHLVARCEDSEETAEWVAALQGTRLLCSNRNKVHQELRRASFKLHVEQNVRSKVIIGTADHSTQLPKVTYLNRTPWDQRARSVSMDSKLNTFHDNTFSPAHLSFAPQAKRCYTYNENIVLSTPDIPLAQISRESQRFPSSPGPQFPPHISPHSLHQLDLSKSFSSEDVRMVAAATKRRYSRPYPRAEDADSGQGSEDSNVLSESNAGGTQDGNLLNITGETNESGTQDTMTTWVPPVRPGRVQWLKDRDLPKDTREPEIVFNPSGLSLSGKRYTSPENYRIPQSLSPKRVMYDASPNGKLHQGKWSSDLDLVPEGREVSMFRTREHAEIHRLPDHRRDCFLSSKGTLSSHQGGVSKQHPGNREGNIEQTKPHGLRRYNLHNGMYSVSNKTSQYSDSTVNTGQPPIPSSFERQNKLYQSLDSALVGKYDHQGHLGAPESWSPYKDMYTRDSPRHSETNVAYVNPHATDTAPPYIRWHRGCDRCPYSEQTRTSSQPVEPHYHDNSFPSSSHSSTHCHKYHDYEEAETDFSGPDDGDTETGDDSNPETKQAYVASEDHFTVSMVTRKQRMREDGENMRSMLNSSHGNRPNNFKSGERSNGGLSRGSQDVKYYQTRRGDKSVTSHDTGKDRVQGHPIVNRTSNERERSVYYV